MPENLPIVFWITDQLMADPDELKRKIQFQLEIQRQPRVPIRRYADHLDKSPRTWWFTSEKLSDQVDNFLRDQNA